MSEPPPGARPGPYVLRPPGPFQESQQSRRHGRNVDRVLGILIGLVLGVAVVAGFVFLGSEGTIDAPRISGVKTGKQQEQAPAPQDQPPSPGQAGR